jgi:hypothetical protein
MALNDVRGRFRTARKNMNNSQNDLKLMFDKHVEVFDNDKIMEILQELAKNMNECFDGAKAGMTTLERATEWLKVNGTGTFDKIE